jgi:hypothetical protein
MKHGDPTPRGTFDIHGKCTVVEVPPSQSRMKNFPLHCFRVKFGKKDAESMLLAADSAEKAAEWKSFLDEMVNKAANRAPMERRRRPMKRASFGAPPENMMKAIERTRNNQRQATGVGQWRVAAITNGVRVLEEIVSTTR